MTRLVTPETLELRAYWQRFDLDLLRREAEMMRERESTRTQPQATGFTDKSCARCGSSFKPTGPRSRHCDDCREARAHEPKP